MKARLDTRPNIFNETLKHPVGPFLAAITLVVIPAVGISGCKANSQTGSLLASTAGAVCDVAALEQSIESFGVIETLGAEISSCLDPDQDPSSGPDSAANAASDTESAGSDGTSLPPVQAGLSLTGGRYDLSFVVGYEVMNDLLDAVSRSSLEGGAGQINADTAKLRSQAEQILATTEQALAATQSTLAVSIHYSFSDLYAFVKSNFVDPAVYGYQGIGHRIIHRRYANGRGLVYRIVSRKLAEALVSFEAKAAQELQAMAKPHFSAKIIRHQGSLSMQENSFMSLYSSGQAVANLPWSRVQELSTYIQR